MKGRTAMENNFFNFNFTVKGFDTKEGEEAAKEAASILGACIERRTSEKGTRVFFEAKRGEEDACIVQEAGDTRIDKMSGKELASAFEREFATRKRSRDFVDGKVPAKEFGGYVPPEVLANEDYKPVINTDYEEEEDRSC